MIQIILNAVISQAIIWGIIGGVVLIYSDLWR